jgi:hypothetical protein
MRIHHSTSTRPTRLVPAVTAAAALAVTLAACSGSGGPTASAGPGATAAATHASSAAPAASSAPATSSPPAATAAAGLSGTWRGQYSGSYAGTFHLTWRQSGTRLSGTIRLSAPATTLPINGRVRGDAIRFGTLGSLAITYSGSVSGSSMSGSYKVSLNGGSTGGSWSASKA